MAILGRCAAGPHHGMWRHSAARGGQHGLGAVGEHSGSGALLGRCHLGGSDGVRGGHASAHLGAGKDKQPVERHAGQAASRHRPHLQRRGLQQQWNQGVRRRGHGHHHRGPADHRGLHHPAGSQPLSALRERRACHYFAGSCARHRRARWHGGAHCLGHGCQRGRHSHLCLERSLGQLRSSQQPEHFVDGPRVGSHRAADADGDRLQGPQGQGDFQRHRQRGQGRCHRQRQLQHLASGGQHLRHCHRPRSQRVHHRLCHGLRQ